MKQESILMEQETLNQLFKEFYSLTALTQKDQNELDELFLYYQAQEQKYLQQFNECLITQENDLRQLHMFISRLSECYQALIARKLIARSKASTFVPIIYNCLTQMYDGKTNVLVLLIQAIFQECKLQLEIFYRKVRDGEQKRVHSQDNEDTHNLTNLYYSMNVGQRKNSIPDWQLNVKVNKTLNTYYNNVHSKLYNVVEKNQEEQFVYYQSREQNQEKLFAQLMEQNSNIKKSINWAQHIDPQKYSIKMERRNQKLQSIAQTLPTQQPHLTPQLSSNTSPVKQLSIPPPALMKKSALITPIKNLKQRSISQNGHYDITNSSLLNPSILNISKQNQQLPMHKVQIEFKTKSVPYNVLKRKMLFDLLPLHNSRLKVKLPKNYLQI